MGSVQPRIVEVPGPPAGRSEDDEVEYRWVFLADVEDDDQ